MASRIEALFTANSVRTLVASAACGADLIAHEVATRLGVRRRVILPFPIEEFREASVTDRPGDWGLRFDRAMRDARVAVLGFERGDKGAYQKTNIAILQEAASLGEPLAVVVWDGQSRGSSDYTAHFRAEAETRGLTVIDVSTI